MDPLITVDKRLMSECSTKSRSDDEESIHVCRLIGEYTNRVRTTKSSNKISWRTSEITMLNKYTSRVEPDAKCFVFFFKSQCTYFSRKRVYDVYTGTLSFAEWRQIEQKIRFQPWCYESFLHDRRESVRIKIDILNLLKL